MALILTFVNKSNLAPLSDYAVQVLVGDGTPERSKVLYESVVSSHARKDGWESLVRAFMDTVGS